MRRVSVIPVMVHPERGTYVLLGKNKGGDWKGALKWGDFGGRAKHNDKDEEQIAAREVAEESLETLVKYHECAIFAQALRDKQYVYKLEDQFNTTFVVRFSWDPSKVFEFSLLRKVLTAFYKLSKGHELSLADAQQLGRYRWFTRDTRLTRILEHPAITTRLIKLSNADISSAQCKLANALRLQEPRPSSSSMARVVVSIDPSWLEKDDLHLFSLEQLRIMLCNNGIWCRGLTCSEIDDASRHALSQLCKMQRFYGCPSASSIADCPFEEDLDEVA